MLSSLSWSSISPKMSSFTKSVTMTFTFLPVVSTEKKKKWALSVHFPYLSMYSKSALLKQLGGDAVLYLFSWPLGPMFPSFCSWSQHSLLAWPTDGTRSTAVDGRIRKSNIRNKLQCTILMDLIRILDTCTDADLLTSNAYALPMPSEAPVTTKTWMQR